MDYAQSGFFGALAATKTGIDNGANALAAQLAQPPGA